MNIRNRFSILCVMLFVLSASCSWAFERQAHIEMSRAAVGLYLELYTADALNDHELTTLFIDASAREDDITLSMQRLFNWHFYDPGSRLGHSWWGASKSNSRRYAALVEDLIAAPGSNPEGIYEYAGRLAHHIQDMSSPPHTVPVYHTTNDPFDKYSTGTISHTRPAKTSLDDLKGDRKQLTADLLNEMLKSAAERTIKTVAAPVSYNGSKIATDWTGFWRSHELAGNECGEEPRAGFGCYGKNTFGKASGSFTPEVYLDFYKTQVSYGIEDTLRLLIMLHDLKNRKALSEGRLDTALN